MRGQISTAAKPCPTKPELLRPGSRKDFRSRAHSLSAVASSRRAPASFARRIAIAAINRPITSRLKRNGSWLTAARTNHRSSLRRSRTVAGSPSPSLLVFLCLAARLATLWGRVTTFLKERLISSGEGEVLPAIAARNLHISGHRSPWGELYSPIRKILKGFF